MSASNFIVSRLKQMATKINGINIKYAYDNVTRFHVVEISPESIRRGDDAYMEMEAALWYDFHNSYPEEDILICDPDDINNMEMVIYEVTSISQPYKYEEQPLLEIIGDSIKADVHISTNYNIAA
jgi:hypothetical protein